MIYRADTLRKVETRRMSFFQVFGPGALVVALLMTITWAIGAMYRDASLVDRIWGLGFLMAMLGYIYGAERYEARVLVSLALLAVWAVRLSWHIHQRNRGHGEDSRYTAMRKKIGPAFVWQSFFRVNMLQGVLLLIISAPLFVLARGEGSPFPGVFDALGISVFIIGFLFEAVGDAQLKAFKADPANRGQVLRTGLWGLTRHPNYFGDALLWWGLWIIALSCPGGIYTVFGPALMSFFLRRVSGVSLLEKDLLRRKPAYAAYIAEVPPFVPRLPRWLSLGQRSK